MHRRELAVLVVAAVALRWLYVGDQLWFDEAITWKTIRGSWPELLRSVAADNHPPLYFVLARLVCEAFGDSILALRVTSVALAALSVITTHLLAEHVLVRRDELAGKERTWLVLLPTALMAVFPLQVVVGAEARMYPLGVLLATTCSWLYLRNVSTPARPHHWLAYGLSGAMCALTHYYLLAVPAVHLASSLAARWRGSARLAASTPRAHWIHLFFPFVVFLFWAPIFIAQARQVGDDWWLPPLQPSAVLQLWTQLVVAGLELGRWSLPLPISLAAGLLLVVALTRVASRGRLPERAVVALAVLPFALGVLGSLVGGQTIIREKYLLFLTPYVWVGVAAALQGLRSRLLSALAMGSLLLVNLVALAGLGWISRAWDERDVAPAVVLAASQSRVPGDVVIQPFLYFLLLPERPHAFGTWRISMPERGVQHFAGGSVLNRHDAIEPALARRIGARERMILVDAVCMPLAEPVPQSAVIDEWHVPLRKPRGPMKPPCSLRVRVVGAPADAHDEG